MFTRSITNWALIGGEVRNPKLPPPGCVRLKKPSLDMERIV